MKRSPLVIIFITILIDLIGFGLVIPILPFYVESPQFSASPRMVGFLFASYSLMQFIFTPVLGRLSDKYGRRRVLLLSIIGTGIGFYICGAATNIATWSAGLLTPLVVLFAGRIIDGITGGNISTAQAYIADITTQEERSKAMGMVGAAFGLGFIFGPALGGILSRYGVETPFYVAAAMAFINAILVYFNLPETITPERAAEFARRKQTSSGSVRTQMTRSPVVLISILYFLIITAFSMMTSSLALYTMYRFDFNAQDNGYLFAFIGVLAVIVQVAIIRRGLKSFGEMPFILIGVVMLLIGLIALPFSRPEFGGLTSLMIAGGLVSIGNQLATPLLTGLASKAVSPDVQGGVLGVLQSVGSLARFVGPLLQAALIVDGVTDRISDKSLQTTFWTAAVITVISCVLAFVLARVFVRAADTGEPVAA